MSIPLALVSTSYLVSPPSYLKRKGFSKRAYQFFPYCPTFSSPEIQKTPNHDLPPLHVYSLPFAQEPAPSLLWPLVPSSSPPHLVPPLQIPNEKGRLEIHHCRTQTLTLLLHHPLIPPRKPPSKVYCNLELKKIDEE